jgi:hypothetical protein
LAHLNAMKQRDYKTLIEEPEVHFPLRHVGDQELARRRRHAGRDELDMELLDYVPCYRSEAGTGSGMAFATWHVVGVKSHQDKMQFGSSGVGGATHLACAQVMKAVGVTLAHVPYRSAVPAFRT